MSIDEPCTECARLRRERDGFAAAMDLELRRLSQIAKALGVTDYIDSIGPLLDAIDRMKAERDSAQRDAAETFEKWHTKARVYGAIAARYQRALAKIDHPEARAAEAWRYSESCGVPRAALAEAQSLLDAQSALTHTTAAGKALADAASVLLVTNGHGVDERGAECPEGENGPDIGCTCVEGKLQNALSAWDRRDGEVG